VLPYPFVIVDNGEQTKVHSWGCAKRDGVCADT